MNMTICKKQRQWPFPQLNNTLYETHLPTKGYQKKKDRIIKHPMSYTFYEPRAY